MPIRELSLSAIVMLPNKSGRNSLALVHHYELRPSARIAVIPTMRRFLSSEISDDPSLSSNDSRHKPLCMCCKSNADVIHYSNCWNSL